MMDPLTVHRLYLRTTTHVVCDYISLHKKAPDHSRALKYSKSLSLNIAYSSDNTPHSSAAHF
jgi:hypothetical protein